MEEFCQERHVGAVGFFFFWMVWEIIGTPQSCSPV